MSVVELKVKVIPGAREDRVLGFEGDVLKVKVSAPPSGGKANKALVRLLADVFRMKKGNIEIVRGLRSRNKLIRVTDVDREVFTSLPRL